MANDPTGTGSPTESEDAIRHLKASQSVEAAFQGAGFPSPPGDVAALVTNYVKSAVKGLPISQIANMSPGSGALAAAALAGVDQFVSSLTPTQREAVRKGVNPLDAAAMLKFGGELNQSLNGKPFAPNGGPNGARVAAEAPGKASPGTWEPSSGGTGLNAKNFGGTEFFKNGLDLGTTKEMFRQGFNQHEIVKAAKDAGSLGIPVNKDAPLIADLNKHDPQFMPRAHQSKDHWHEYYEDERGIKRNDDAIAKLRQAGKNAEADALQAKNDAAKKKHNDDRQHHEKFDDDTVRSTSKPRQGKAKTILEDIRRREQQLSPNLDTHQKVSGIDSDTSKKIIRNYHHNPNDPIASGKYAALLQSGDHSPASKRAVAEIDKTIKQAARLKKIQTAGNAKDVAANKGKAAEKAVATVENDDALAALNLSEKTKPDTKSEPGKPAKKTEPAKPQPKKVGQAKPATLHA